MENKKISFYIKIYKKILIQDLKSKMSYRADFFISMIGMICTNIAGLVSFWIIFRNFPSIKGWNYYEMLFLYGFSLISLTPVQCFFDNNWNLRNYVYSGDFIKYFFRPINLFFYYQSEVFDIKGIGQFFFGIYTLVYAWVKLEIVVTPFILIKAIIFLLTASLVMISLQNVAAATCFWIHNSAYIMDLIFKIKDYSKYPITIFSTLFRFVFTFVIPIAFIAFYPSLVILRPSDVPVLSWISPIMGCIFFYISYKIWMYSALRYSGTGS